MGGRMRFEEALEILYKGIAPNPTANNECIELCKKALEKQIPKKPRETRCALMCANCGHKITEKGCKKQNRLYCKKCGQAICWDNEVGEN